MIFRRISESLEDKRDLLLLAGDYKCKLTQYDIDEAADYSMLLDDIKAVYSVLVGEFGNKLKRWSYYEDDDVDFGYKVILTDGTKYIVEINNEGVDIVEGLKLTEEAGTKFIIVAVTKDGTSLFYNSIDDNFVTNSRDATIYNEHDTAIDDWHKIDKSQFKRVFVPNYDPKLFESFSGSNMDNYTDYDLLNLPVGTKIELEDMEGNIHIGYALGPGQGKTILVTFDEAERYNTEDRFEEISIDNIVRVFDDFDEALDNKETICCICNEPFTGYGNNADPVCSGRCCDKCNAEKVIPARLSMLNNYDEECETDYRYYVYENEDDVVGDSFEYDEDAIEWAKENGYPIVKIHNYYRDECGKLQPDGYPEVIWEA